MFQPPLYSPPAPLLLYIPPVMAAASYIKGNVHMTRQIQSCNLRQQRYTAGAGKRTRLPDINLTRQGLSFGMVLLDPQHATP